MKDYVPLIERTEVIRGEEADTVRVWFRVSSPEHAAALRDELKAGHWVVLVARVNAVRAAGGYVTGSRPPGSPLEDMPVEAVPIEYGFEFRLERSEIYFSGVAIEPREEK